MANQQNYGYPVPFSQCFPAPILAARAPTTSDIQYPIGQLWVNTDHNDGYMLVDVTAATATWALITPTH